MVWEEIHDFGAHGYIDLDPSPANINVNLARPPYPSQKSYKKKIKHRNEDDIGNIGPSGCLEHKGTSWGSRSCTRANCGHIREKGASWW